MSKTQQDVVNAYYDLIANAEQHESLALKRRQDAQSELDYWAQQQTAIKPGEVYQDTRDGELYGVTNVFGSITWKDECQKIGINVELRRMNKAGTAPLARGKCTIEDLVDWETPGRYYLRPNEWLPIAIRS